MSYSISRQPGFTLLELLVAASLFIGLSVVLFGTLANVLATYTEHDQVQRSNVQAQLAFETIGDSIREAQFIDTFQSSDTSYGQVPNGILAVIDPDILPTGSSSSKSLDLNVFCALPNQYLAQYQLQFSLSQENSVEGIIASYEGQSFSCSAIEGTAVFGTLGTFTKSPLSDTTVVVNAFSVTPVVAQAPTTPASRNPPGVRIVMITHYAAGTARASTAKNAQPEEVLQDTFVNPFNSSMQDSNSSAAQIMYGQ